MLKTLGFYTLKSLKSIGMAIPFWVRIYYFVLAGYLSYLEVIFSTKEATPRWLLLWQSVNSNFGDQNPYVFNLNSSCLIVALLSKQGFSGLIALHLTLGNYRTQVFQGMESNQVKIFHLYNVKIRGREGVWRFRL